MKKAVFLILSLSAFILVSCGGGGGGGGGNPPPPVTISISPTSPTVGGSNTQQFTATVGNTSNTAVTWQVEGIPGGNATVGTVSATGLYTAPFFIPANATVSVTAVAQADTSKSASATVTIVFSNAMLIGQYAFSYVGWDPSFFTIAGSISANGNGAITGGVSDLNNSLGVSTGLTLTGTYTASPDGLVEILLTDSQPASYTLRAAMVSPDHLRVIQFDTTSTGQGSIDWQDPAAFNDAAFAGGYAFRLDGYGFTGYTAGIAGRMTADNAGNLTAGVMDINENYIDTNADVFTGTYTTIDANGRGEVTLDTNQGLAVFAFYIASSGKVHLISIDSIGLPWMLGVAEKQTPGFFSNANLSGDYAYFVSVYSSSASGIYYSAGRFTANGTGGVNAGVSDENDNGVTTENLAFTGTYSVDAFGDGRGTGIFTSARGSSNFTFYMVSPSRALFVQQGTFALGTGEVDAQTGGPYSTASLAGNFGISMDGYPSMLVGQFEAAGGTTSGTVHLTTFDNTGSVLTLTPDQAFSATYSVTANGRGDFTVSDNPPITFHLYMVSGSKVHLIGMSDVFLGTAEMQY